MLIQKHDLLHELPGHRDTIHELKMTNARFAKLFEEHQDTNCWEFSFGGRALNPLFDRSRGGKGVLPDSRDHDLLSTLAAAKGKEIVVESKTG